VLAPAITWEDARADAWVSERLDAADRRAIYERTGMPIDGRYLAPMLRFHRSDRIDEMTAMLSAKDYLCYALTGASVTDPSTAAGYGVYALERGAFSEELCAVWELPSRLLPAVRPAHALAAPLSDAGARLLGLPAGVPVTVGAADSVAGAYALAGLEEGTVCISMGSSTIIIDSLNSARLDPQARYLLTPHVEPGWYGREMDLLASGTGYRWLSGLFGWREGELDRMAAQSVPGARGLNFAPYLARGEQGALWNPALRGAIHGLGLTHGPQDIARAFVEGVSFEILRCLDVLGTRGAAQSLVVSGAIVERATSLQVLADVLAQPVYAVRAVSPAAEGAAMGARVLANLPPGVPHARRGTVACVQPSAERVARYRQLYDDYRAVVDR
jgi:xylulokinase